MTYSIEENHHSGLELYFMPRFFVYNPCRRLQDGEDVFFSVLWWYHLYILEERVSMQESRI